MGPDSMVEIGDRPIPQEPMVCTTGLEAGIHLTEIIAQYIIFNLGMSPNFGKIDFDHLTFPTKMLVDYIRVYQPSNQINIGCDPSAFPTAAYINQSVTLFISQYVFVTDLSSLKV
jgi:hypothetical protein